MKKRIIIVDHRISFINLMKEFINEDPEWEVSLVVTTKKDFFNAIGNNSFDVALIEISIEKHEEGLDILSLLKKNGTTLPVIILSAHDEVLYARQCLEIGAKGYISKECIAEDLMRGLNEVMGGHLFVSGKKGNNILEEYRRSNPVA